MEAIREYIKKLTESGKIFNAYIFEGQEEVTNSMCNYFANGLYRPGNEDIKPFENFVDVEVIQPENSVISIEKVRDMKKRVFEKPLQAKHKIFVINQAHYLRKESQNAILKTLEEAPDYTIIILATDNKNKLEDTIISRCQVISNYKEKISELDQDEKEGLYNIVLAAKQKNIYKIINSKTYFEKLSDRKREITKELTGLLNDILMHKLGIKTNFSVRYIKMLTKFEDLSINKIEKLIIELEKINEMLSVSINFQLAIENFLFTLMEE